MAEEKKVKQAMVESQYTVAELVKAPKLFNSTPDLIATALKLDGKELYTLKEAQRVVKVFGDKKIK